MTGRKEEEREEKSERQKEGRRGGEYEHQMQKRTHEKKRAFKGCVRH